MIEHVLVTALVCLVVYFRTIYYGLVVDDVCRLNYTLPKTVRSNGVETINKHYRTLYDCGVGRSRWSRLVQSLHGSSVIMNLKLDHAVTIFIHTAVSCLVTLAFGILPGLLFAVHPVNNQVSVWLNGKRYGISTIICLCVWLLKPYGLLLYPLVFIWHQNAMLSPALMFLTQWWYLPLLSPILFLVKPDIIRVFKARMRKRADEIPDADPKHYRWGKYPMFFKTFAYYTLHCVFPRKMSFYHSFLDNHGYSRRDNKECCKKDKMFWTGVGLLSAMTLCIAMFWGTPISFGLFWWVLFISQCCNFPVTLSMHISDRNCYLPNIGICAALAAVINLIPDMTVKYVVYTAMFTYYLTRLVMYMPKYKDVDPFVMNVLDVFPDNSRVSRIAVQSLLGDHKFFHAIKYCADGLCHRPNDFTLNVLMAKTMNLLNQKSCAMRHIEVAEKNLVCGAEQHNLELVARLKQEISKPTQPINIRY